jgi:hypothetical protein
MDPPVPGRANINLRRAARNELSLDMSFKSKYLCDDVFVKILKMLWLSMGIP